MSRLLGLDIGEKRIGVAVSDPGRRVATPLTVLDAARVRADARELIRLIDQYEASGLIVGLPLTLSGEEGPQARRVRESIGRLAQFLPVPVSFVDERLTSSEAGRRMREAGLTEKQQRGSKDMVAAAILLQAYLDESHEEHDDAEADGGANTR
ncbi:MAG: Holliday junction resolvase RuvX [Coriobacteriia bacterium]|nr:Holliday junction resolvase RuvX [Coriobacteriia bacterium]